MTDSLAVLAFVGAVSLAGCIVALTASTEARSPLRRTFLLVTASGQGTLVVGALFLASTLLWP